MNRVWILWALFGVSDFFALGLIGNYFWPPRKVVNDRFRALGFGTALAFYVVSADSLWTAISLIVWPAPAQQVNIAIASRVIARSIRSCVLWYVYTHHIRGFPAKEF